MDKPVILDFMTLMCDSVKHENYGINKYPSFRQTCLFRAGGTESITF